MHTKKWGTIWFNLLRKGLKALQESVDLFGKDSPKTVLNPDLRGGADPDDFFSKVPYGKLPQLSNSRTH